MTSRTKRIVCSLPFAAGIFPAAAQTAPSGADAPAVAVTSLHRTSSPISIDGRLDDAAWDRAQPLPLTLRTPTFEGVPTERTIFRVMYDETFLYLGGWLYDSNPSGIRANSLYRDGTNGSDQVTLIVDPYNDNQNARMFWTNPAGLRGDQAISADGGSRNLDWNTHWEVATSADDDGWYAEMRIPFSSLGFKSEGEDASMGLIVSRLIARKNEEVIFPAISPSWSTTTPSQAADVSLSRIESQNPLYITPYILGGLGQRYGQGPAFEREDKVARDIGLDLKYNVTNTLTLDATVNTDFAQAEADNQQVNLTRFSLFFPDKRQFFQERAGLFDFRTSNERLFHSRRIGLVQGASVPILGGVRLVGRAGAWDVGLMNMQTARHDASETPSENMGVVRLQRGVFNPYSTMGGIVTSRVGADGAYNIAAGADAQIRLVGDEYVGLKWAHTWDDALSHGLAENSLVELDWQRRRLRGWSYQATLTRMGAAFEPDLGFVTRRDYTQVSWLLHHNAFPGADSPFTRRMLAHLNGNVAWRNADGTVESALVSVLPYLWWKSGGSVGISGSVEYEDLRRPLRLPGGTSVAAGSYTFGRGDLHLGTSSARRFQATGFLSGGTFYDGWRADISIGPVWNASRHMRISPSYIVTRVRFPDRDQGFDAHIARLRIEAALDTRLSLNTFLQYSSTAAAISINTRFRFNVREGNDLWIVYNEGLNTDRNREPLALPLTSERTVLLKYTYTFVQ